MCIILLLHHKIVHPQKILPRYENMVFFTVTRSFFYWCTIILKILLFVVCAVVFLLRVIYVYVLWIFHNLWQIRTILNRTVRHRTVTESKIIYCTYSLHMYIRRLSFKETKKTRNIIKNKAKIPVAKKSVFEFSLFYFSQSLHYFSL